jgi:hypothetical protein
VAYSQTDLSAVLTAVRARLIAQSVFTSANIRIAFSRPETVPKPGPIFAIVYPADGQFDQPMLDGGGNQQCNEDALIVVEIFGVCNLDQGGTDDIFLNHATRGVLPVVRLTLKALTAHMLVHPSSGNELLRQPMLPVNRQMPRREDESIGSIAVTLSALFEWDLTT